MIPSSSFGGGGAEPVDTRPAIQPRERESASFQRGGVHAELARLGPLPYLKIAATGTGDPELPRVIGEAHGELLRDKIGEVWRFYRGRFKDFSDEKLQALAERFERTIERFDPSYAEEIRGIAKGAGLERWQAFALNSRTELINLARKPALECTSVSFREAGIVGQTWDWGEDLGPLMTAIEIQRPDGHTVFFLAEPGIIGKMGMNSQGLGVALNILRGSAACDGVPIHVLLRATLDSASFEEAMSRLKHAALGTMSHLLITDDRGQQALVEFHGSAMHVVRGAGSACHTNHYLSPGTENISTDYSGANSKTRFDRATELLQGVTEPTVSEMKRVLTDRANGEHSISATPKYYADYGMSIGTIITAVMDLRERTIHFAHLSDNHRSFTVHRVDPGEPGVH